MKKILHVLLLPVLFCLHAGLLYGQLIVWNTQWLGIVLFFSFLGIVGEWWRHILQHVFGIKKKTWTARVMSWCIGFSLLGLAVSILITWYRFAPLFLWGCFVSIGVISWVLSLVTKKHKTKEIIESELHPHIFSRPVFSKRLIIPIIYLLLWAVGAIALVHSESSTMLLSPWQTIKPYYLPIFFALTFILGVMVFSYYGTKVMLFFLVLHSLLLHLYLPLTHENPWGGDVWRHISMEQQLQRGDTVRPVLFGPDAEWRDVGVFTLPAVFLQPQKYAYGHLWGTTLVVSEMMRLDLVTVNKWLLPLLWSLVVPFLLFYLGRQLFRSPRAALFLVWLSCLPFSLQALGGLTLPVSLGFVLFLCIFSLCVSWVESRDMRQLFLILFFSVLMIFGYPLYSIFIWIMLLSAAVLKTFSRHILIVTGVLVLLAPFILPGIEFTSGISRLPVSWYALDKIMQVAGEWSGGYFAAEIRPHDIASGNIIINHTPLTAFVDSPFTSWRWHIPFFLLLLWAGIIFGLVKAWQEQTRRSKLYLILFSLLIGGYVLGWYVLEGDRLLVRRTDALVAFVTIAFFVYGLQQVRDIANAKKKRIAVCVILLLLSWSATTVYASGPDMQVVSVDEYTTAEMIWQHEQGKQTHCVLAETWPLLALEAISSGSIVGGGFPMDYQFGQPQRVELFETFYQEPNSELLERAHTLTNADRCWVAYPNILFAILSNTEKMEAFHRLLGDKVTSTPGILLWHEGLKSGQN